MLLGAVGSTEKAYAEHFTFLFNSTFIRHNKIPGIIRGFLWESMNH